VGPGKRRLGGLGVWVHVVSPPPGGPIVVRRLGRMKALRAAYRAAFARAADSFGLRVLEPWRWLRLPLACYCSFPFWVAAAAPRVCSPLVCLSLQLRPAGANRRSSLPCGGVLSSSRGCASAVPQRPLLEAAPRLLSSVLFSRLRLGCSPVSSSRGCASVVPQRPLLEAAPRLGRRDPEN